MTSTSTETKLKVIIAGVGGRGSVYARHFQRFGHSVVALAEPREKYREIIAQECNVSAEHCYSDWREMAALERFADIVVISTQDDMHVEPVKAFAAKGYHILLEKPMAPDLQGCREILQAVKDNQIQMSVCHVLRYTKYTRKIKELLQSGCIGDIVSIQHLEQVKYWHQAHSFVRGNWRNSQESSPMILAKSCHDLDWLRYIMDCSCLRVSSFGSLYHFRSENKPAAAAERCLDCPQEIENSCPYSAKRFYLGRVRKGEIHWPLDVLCPNPDENSITEALRTGPYGRCVYACDNDVVDHQVVNMEFANGRSVSFTMTAFTLDGGRKTTIFGTHGQLIGDGSKIEVCRFNDESRLIIDTAASSDDVSGGHGGGDGGIVDSLQNAILSPASAENLSDPEVSLESHLIAFAAEISRKEKRVVELSELMHQ